MSFYHTEKRRSRRLRRCSECTAPIRTGTLYVRAVGVFEGDFFAEAFHVECHDLYQKAHSIADPLERWDFAFGEIDSSSADDLSYRLKIDMKEALDIKDEHRAIKEKYIREAAGA